MTVLQQAAHDQDRTALVNLIARRLGGEQLDSPFGERLGTDARDILVALHRNYPGPVQTAIRDLLVEDGEAEETLAVFMQDARRSRRASWLIEFFLFLRDIRYSPADSSLLCAFCHQIMRLEGDSGRIVPVKAALLQAAAVCGGSLDALIIGQLLAHKDIATTKPFLHALSGVTPERFLREFAPLVLTRFARKEKGDDGRFRFLADALFNAINVLQDSGDFPKGCDLDVRSIKTSALGEFLEAAATCAHYPSGQEIRAAVCAALFRSDLPAAVVRRFERDYWDKVSVDTDWDDSTAERQELNKIIRSRYYPNKLFHRTVVMNLPSSADAAFLSLFKAVLWVGYGTRLVLQPLIYEGVRTALVDGHIDVAVHDPSLLTETDRFGREGLILQSAPLIQVKHYTVFANWSRLRDMARHPPSPEVGQWALALLNREATEDAPLRRALQTLIPQGRIAFAANTEVKRALVDVFGRLEDNEDGFDALLDGQVCFYVGDALHCDYAPSRVLVLGKMASGTTLRFYTTQNAYTVTTHKDLLDHLMCVWRVVRLIWQKIRNSAHGSRTLQPILERLRTEMVLGVNRNPALRTGFVSSYESLEAVFKAQFTELPDLSVPDAEKQEQYFSSVFEERVAQVSEQAATSGVANLDAVRERKAAQGGGANVRI